MMRLRPTGTLLMLILLAGLLPACGGDQQSQQQKEQTSSQSTEQAQQGITPAQEKPVGKTKGSIMERSGQGPAADAANNGEPSTHVGRLVLLRGEVEIKRPGLKRALTPKLGFKVFLNDRIITHRNGYARMRLRDDSILRIAPTSELAVTRQLLGPGNNNTTIDLLKGKLRAIVVHKLVKGESFEVKTDVAVAGVRGTDFEVIAGKGTVIRCYKGVVAIRNVDAKVGGRVLLKPRTFTQVGLERPPLPAMRLPAKYLPMEDPAPLPDSTPPTIDTHPPGSGHVSPPRPTTAPVPPVTGLAVSPSLTPPAVTDEAETPPEQALPPVEVPEQSRPPRALGPGISENLMNQSYDSSIEQARKGKLKQLWEQDQQQPLRQLLYGDGLNGWTLHPAP